MPDVVRQGMRLPDGKLIQLRTFVPRSYDKPWEVPRWTVFGERLASFRLIDRKEHEVRMVKHDADATGTP